MVEVSNNQNLSAHYSTSAKVTRPERPVANPPATLTKPHLFDDKDANNRLKMINQDIYKDSKKEENKAGVKFLKIFGGIVAAILLIKGIKNIRGAFKKS